MKVKAMKKITKAVFPVPVDAPFLLGVFGRYILTPRVFHHLQRVKPGTGARFSSPTALRG
jgi:UTP--glucose-1-phosphate uridylyltransferase